MNLIRVTRGPECSPAVVAAPANKFHCGASLCHTSRFPHAYQPKISRNLISHPILFR